MLSKAPRLENALEVVHLVSNQIAEGHSESRNRRLVERDHGVSEGDEQQQLCEVEHLLAQAIAREHHLDAMPRNDDRRQRHKQPVPETQELRFMDCQQVGDRLLDRRNEVHLRLHGISFGWFYGCRQVRSASPAPCRNALLAVFTSRHVVSCMLIAVASASLARLLSTSNCSTTPASNCTRACR